MTALTGRLRLVNLAVAVVAWAAVAVLVRAFVTSDLSLRIVAENSRRDAPWAYRVAAVWGNAPGSLLLFAAVVAAVGWVGTARSGVRANAAVGAVGASLTALGLVVGRPFAHLDIPATGGFGLTPILEHPAMAVHPPLLYLGLAATLPAFALALDGDAAHRAHRWLLLALGAMTLAMALGAWWSYAEQGWGGYWAWDPVENGSLAPWLAGVWAVHQPADRRPARAGLPWCLALAGAAVARSGAVSSVHTFADSPFVGWTLGGLALACTGVLAAAARLGRRDPAHAERRRPSAPPVTAPGRPGPAVERADALHPHGPVVDRGDAVGPPVVSAGAGAARWLGFPAVLALAALIVVIIGTAAPLVARATPIRPFTVGGWFFARLVAPLALAGVGVLGALRLSGAGRLVRPAAWVAHLGIAVLVTAVVASGFDRSGAATIGEGETVTVAGVSVTNRGIDVRPGRRAGVVEVAASLDVGGHLLVPALTAYPERGGVLAETAMVSRPWRDVQAVLVDADDTGRALVEIRVKPLVQFVWLGALLVVVGCLGAARSPPGRRSPQW